MTKSIWICWMSLVLRVMREAVEKWSNSVWEKPTTLRNTRPRSSRPRAAATRAAKKLTRMVTAMLSSAIPSILAPESSTYPFWIPSTSIPSARYSSFR